MMTRLEFIAYALAMAGAVWVGYADPFHLFIRI